MSSSGSYSTRELFGGGLTTYLPSNVIDASELRQVPDTQEVFLLPDSDVSIIFEILQIVQEGGAKDDLREAVRYHFNSIAHDNTALSSSIDNVSSPFPLPTTSTTTTSTSSPSPHLYTTLEGVQIVSKFNLAASQADSVKIFLALIRVDLKEPSAADPSISRGADITICVNVPLGQAAEVEQGKVSEDAKKIQVEAKEWFQESVRSFSVRDYGLFA